MAKVTTSNPRLSDADCLGWCLSPEVAGARRSPKKVPSTSLRFREGDLRERPREYAAIFLDVETSARRPDKRPPEMRNLSSGLISGFFENGAATAAAGLACPGGLACGVCTMESWLG